ncbi:EAL domain-containing protein [Leptospira yasudae]|uniref:EAL domain-containing protein n=1 Tax=Leptospira yasudae TaxID=2202201 RepID=A0A6N4QIY1_9LEPT|nr:EAL domain-containing protein [Leptospira yasudae]TGL81425.1 EAL domain-containing protein [Leptospira yasudae]TGL81732.1 EAL domain-containing protein [Leptospira yasudae]TGL88108.1 EAL domain-containing protein [Leptospira yasudae]
MQNSENIKSGKKPIILLVDDEPIILVSLKQEITRRIGNSYKVETATSAAMAFQILDQSYSEGIAVPLILCDQIMGGMNGDEFLIQAHKKYPDIYKIMLTGQASGDSVGNALNYANLYRYLAKPWNSEDLIFTINEAIRSYFQDQKVRELNSKLEESAYLDRETQRPNFENLRRTLEQKERNQEMSCLAVMRIESFTTIMQSFGMETYIRILNQLYSILDSFLEDKGVLYHIYQDEAAILAKGISEENFCVLLTAFKIFLRSERIEMDGISFRIDISLGVAYDNSLIYHRARLATMNAANNPKTELVPYSESMDKVDRFHFNLRIGKKLNEALSAKNVVPYYQGIYDNKLGKITKYECLARIFEMGKVISPCCFIPIARATGQIQLLTPLIIEKSLKYFASFPEYSLSVNISQLDLEKKGFALWILSRLQHYGIAPERLILEILETDRWNGDANSNRSLHRLKEAGCKIAIDDFGIEQSNFERLMAIQPDFIKIDGKFIKGIHQNPTSYLLVAGITEMAHRIGIQVVAEFVCGKEEFDVVRSLNIEYSQGYHLMAPAPEVLQVSKLDLTHSYSIGS